MAGTTVTYRIAADLTGFKSQLVAGGASLRKFADDATSATKQGVAFRNGLDTVGQAAGKVGLVAAAGLGAAVLASANFEQAMSNVQAATGESAANMDALRDAAIKAGAETAFSAREAADGITQLAKAGVSTQDILSGGLTGALDLAAAGQIEVGEAAEYAAKTMTQFGLAGDEVPHVADLLAAAAGKATGEVADFGAALGQSGIVASQIGVSLEETTGALAAFASAGLLGSDAGTSFKTMLGALTPNSAAAKRELEGLGISAFDAQGNFIGLAEFAGQLQGALQGYTDEARQAKLETIFGSDAIRAASILYEQGESGIRKWTAAVDDQGFAAETAATKLDNLKGDLEALGGSLETALIGAGSGSQGVLRNLVQGATDAVNAFNKLPGPIKNLSSGLLAVVAVTGGAAWFGAKVINGVADTRQAITDLGTAAPKAARGMKLLSGAVGFAGAVIALDSAIDGLLASTRDAIPGTEELAGRLIDLGDGRVADLGKDFRLVGEDIEFLNKNATANSFGSWIPNITGLLPGENSLEQFDRLTAQVEQMDAALSSLVTSGSVETAQTAFEAFARETGLTADQQQSLLDMLPQYGEALAGAANQSKLAADGAETLADGTSKAGDAFVATTAAGQTFGDMLKSLQGLLDNRAAARNYEASLDALRKGLQETGNSFDIAGEKGRANQERLDAFVSSTLAKAEQLSGLPKIKFLQSAADDLARLGREFGIPRSEVKAFTEEWREMAGLKQAKLDAKVDAKQAITAIGETIKQFGILDGKSGGPTVKETGAGKVVDAINATIDRFNFLDRESGGPTVKETGSRETNNAIDGVRRNADSLNGKVSTVTIRTVRETINKIDNIVRNINPFSNADGNILQFADGGAFTSSLGAQSSQIRPYSGVNGVQWSEAGSGPWEAFVSGHPGKAPRSRAIADEVVRRLGGDVVWKFADGGGFARSAAPASGGGMSVSLSDRDVERIASAVAAGARDGTSSGLSRSADTARLVGRGGRL